MKITRKTSQDCNMEHNSSVWIDPPIGWCFYPFIVRNSNELELQKKCHAKFISNQLLTHLISYLHSRAVIVTSINLNWPSLVSLYHKAMITSQLLCRVFVGGCFGFLEADRSSASGLAPMLIVLFRRWAPLPSPLIHKWFPILEALSSHEPPPVSASICDASGPRLCLSVVTWRSSQDNRCSFPTFLLFISMLS